MLSIRYAFVCLFAAIATAQANPEPTLADQSYGDKPSQVFDLYRPDGAGPFPLVIYIHGGGWWNGDKANMYPRSIQSYLDAGVAVASINYRVLPEAKADGLNPPVLGPNSDAKLALQFLRLKSGELKLDPKRVALSGGSAGACTALWLGLSPEMANPRSDKPVERMSTRVLGIGVINAQTSLDPVQMREWAGPELAYGGHAFGLPEKDFEQFLSKRSALLEQINRFSPAALVGRDSPPIFLGYTAGPDSPKKNNNFFVHNPGFGVGFQKLAKSKGATCYLAYPGLSEPAFPAGEIGFVIHCLK
jgi:hypothetical protein